MRIKVAKRERYEKPIALRIFVCSNVTYFFKELSLTVPHSLLRYNRQKNHLQC